MTVRVHLRRDDLDKVQLSSVLAPLDSAAAAMTALVHGVVQKCQLDSVRRHSARGRGERVLDPARAELARDLLALPLPIGFMRIGDADIECALD